MNKKTTNLSVTLKKIVSARVILALVVNAAAVVVPVASWAASTGTVILSGVVPAVTNIVVSSVSGYNNLDMTVTQADRAVASVREINNTAAGYKVTLASQNAGVLRNGSVGSVSYTAKYNGSAVTLSSAGVQVSNVTSGSAVVNVVKGLSISYTGVPSDELMQGTYSDTLTFTISAN